MALTQFPADHLFDLDALPDEPEAIKPAPASISSPSIFDSLKDSFMDSLSSLFSWKQKGPFTKDGFQVALDVHPFTPKDITIKTKEHDITIEAKHDEKEDSDNGFISRHFIRRYKLPKTYDLETIQSSLSEEGILTIKAPAPKEEIEQKDIDRVVPIEVEASVPDVIYDNGYYEPNGDDAMINPED